MILIDLISQDVALTKKGKEWIGLCPFHREKTPSFSVNEEKQVYFCFGCLASGDVISYLRWHRGLTFSQALRILGRDLPLAPVRQSPTHRALAQTRAAYQHWETATLDRVTRDYWQAWERSEMAELQMALLLCQREASTAEAWEHWQRAYARAQQDAWAALEQLNFFQHPATMGERVQWWEREQGTV